MVTKKKLQKRIEELEQDNAMLRLLTKAYMRKCAKQEKHIEFLEASLNATISETDRWKQIAHKADERRRNYVRADNKCSE